MAAYCRLAAESGRLWWGRPSRTCTIHTGTHKGTRTVRQQPAKTAGAPVGHPFPAHKHRQKGGREAGRQTGRQAGMATQSWMQIHTCTHAHNVATHGFVHSCHALLPPRQDNTHTEWVCHTACPSPLPHLVHGLFQDRQIDLRLVLAHLQGGKDGEESRRKGTETQRASGQGSRQV
jgi:hypothetical protein